MSTTYYGSAGNGNNNHSGTDPAQPLRTIQAAVNKLQAGDSVVIRGGVYAERVYIQKPGTADAPIRLAAHEGEHPVIDGASLNIAEDTALVIIQQSQDVSLSGLTIRNSGGCGLAVNQSSRISISGCVIETSYAGGLHANQCETLLIEKCAIHDCARRFLAHGAGQLNVALLVKRAADVTVRENQVYQNSERGILIATGCQRVVVSRNTCYDNRSGQIGVISSLDVTVEANLCYHTGRTEYLDLLGRRGPGITKGDSAPYREDGAWHTRRLQISNNIVVGCGVGFQAKRDGGPLNDFLFTHNTVLNSTTEAIHIGWRERNRSSYFENNLIASNNGGSMAAVPAGRGIVWRHNLWSTFPGPALYSPASDVIEENVGLVNIAMPLTPGAVSADPYKLTATSVAINRGLPDNNGHHLATDFWGATRDSRPDLGANEYPGGSGDEPTDDPTLPDAGVRVTEGLQVLYTFKEGQGQQVRDVAGVGEPLNLRIADPSRVTWSNAGLEVKSATLITSESPARKVITACRASGELTLEAWIQPANTDQDGPARIVSISSSKTERNVTLGQGLYGNQSPDVFIARLRTTKTSTNGLPAVVTPPGAATTSLTHVAYTRRADGRATLYVNGQDRGVLDISGAFSSWDERMPLLLTNELSEDRPWLGTYHLVAIYDRALAAAEVVHNYEAGVGNNSPIIVSFGLLSGSAQGVAPHTVEFDSSESSAASGIAGHFWEFGDGQTSNRPNPSYTYAAPGVYTVSLTINDSAGNTAKASKEGYIVVVSSPIPPLPAEFARFVLVNVTTAAVVGFGLQYPDLRCAVAWNESPFHMLVFSDLDDMRRTCEKGQVELIWVDTLEVS